MPLKDNLAPRDLAPRCVVVKFRHGVTLNSVGLSGPGAFVALRVLRSAMATGKVRRAFVSFMSVADTPEKRLAEAEAFSNIFHDFCLSVGTDNIGLQVNFSCPNVSLPTGELVAEVGNILSAFRESSDFGVPILAKFSAATPVEGVVEAVERSRDCDGVSVSNTIPWGKLPARIDWRGLFGSNESPLKDLGGGGLSGAPLLPIVRDWIFEARKLGLSKAIIGGGGILCRADADSVLDAGADAVELGTVAMLRPWRVAGIVKHVLMRTGYRE